jgi:hypothetical protein
MIPRTCLSSMTAFDMEERMYRVSSLSAYLLLCDLSMDGNFVTICSDSERLYR